MQDHVDPVAAELRLELVGGAVGDDPALVDHGDAVGQLVRLLQILRGEQNGRAAADQRAHRLPHLGTAARVEPGRRLVEEQHLRAR